MRNSKIRNDKNRKGLGLKALIVSMACTGAVLTGVMVWAIFGAVNFESKSGHSIGIVEAVRNMGITRKAEELAAEGESKSTSSQTLTADAESQGAEDEGAASQSDYEDAGSKADCEDAASQPDYEDAASQPDNNDGDEASAVQYELINEAEIENPDSNVVDVAAVESVTAQQVTDWINEYSFGSWTYLDGEAVTEDAKAQILARRNLEAVTDPVEIRYGVVTDNAAIRAFPTWRKASDSLGARAFDYIQESMFITGEPVAVLHQTADGVWSFVQGPNYRGWIETSHVGFCSLDELKEWQAAPKAVVTDARITLGGYSLRMGTALPAETDGEGGITVSLPQTKEDGSLGTEETLIQDGNGVHFGYLELTSDQITAQARLLIGTEYGWGDSNGDMDCSSTMNSILRCFGVILPRNTSRMMYAGTQVVQLSGMSKEEKAAKITTFEPGTLLLMKGHVVMYMGIEDGEPKILHNFTTYLSEDGTLQDVYQCRITELDLTSAGGSYLERYEYAICFNNE